MADTKTTGLSAFTPVLTDIMYGVDDPGGTPISGKHTYQVLMDLFEANFQAPADFIDTITEIAAALKSGADGTLITGTAGTSGNIGQWDANGDLIDMTAAQARTLLNVADGADAWGDAVDADIVPDADGTRDLGTAAARFAELHVDTIDLNGVTLDGTTLADPGADRMLFWDDSASTTAYLTAGTGLDITTTTMTVDVAALSHNVTTDADNYTLVIGDQNGVVLMSGGSANTLTIPTNASVAFPTGTKVEVWSTGAGTTSIAGDTGVTLQGAGGSASAGSCDIQTQYGGATLTKIATDTWIVGGDIDAVA